MPLILALGDVFDLHVGLADQPAALMAGALLREVLGPQVRVHLGLEPGHPRPVGLVDVLSGFRVELGGGQDDDPGLGHTRLRLLDGQRSRALRQGQTRVRIEARRRPFGRWSVGVDTGAREPEAPPAA